MPRSCRSVGSPPSYQSKYTSPPPSYDSTRNSRAQNDQSSDSSSTSSSPGYNHHSHYHIYNVRGDQDDENRPLVSGQQDSFSSGDITCTVSRKTVLVGVALTFFSLVAFILYISQVKSPLTSFWVDVTPEPTCHAIGARDYTATLVNIPKDWDPLQACSKTVLVIHNKTVLSPRLCAYERSAEGETIVKGKWTINFSESDCMPAWSSIDPENCVAWGVRQYHADLGYVPAGLDKLASCKATPAFFHGRSVLPARCMLLARSDENGTVATRGEWDIDFSESSCESNWIEVNADWQCHAYDKKRYTAILDSVPEELDPLQTCYEVPHNFDGVDLKPQSCDWNQGRMEGTWFVGAPECRPVLKDIIDYGCIESQPGFKRVEGEVVDIGEHEDWYRMCTTIPYYWRGQAYLPVQCESRTSWFQTRRYALYNLPSSSWWC
ncbi:hypothetical protein VKT23_014417 [Stygiomarasmius scandens]|uniref:Uncharacterized protein n=1 Tax=Marasmiellus scandens TaxID=2682957 RepID=A0ABR1J5G2_9AGAR